jgi:nitrogen fixation protein NifX
MGESTKITVESGTRLGDAMKVAFASKDMKNINAHFGGAKEFTVYNVSKDGFELDGVIKTDTDDLEGDDKTDFKVKTLSGVSIMYCESIGGTAAAKVIRGGIHPMKVDQPTPIENILKDLVKMVNDNPPPWIKRVMNIETKDDKRLAFWSDEERE